MSEITEWVKKYEEQEGKITAFFTVMQGEKDSLVKQIARLDEEIEGYKEKLAKLRLKLEKLHKTLTQGVGPVIAPAGVESEPSSETTTAITL